MYSGVPTTRRGAVAVVARPPGITGQPLGAKVLIGFDAIAEFTRAVLPAASWAGEVTYEAVHTQFLRPDVAAVKIRQVYHSAENDTESDAEGSPLYVMTKQGDGTWLLHAGQNTEVRAA
ncbi:SgcJ/EcaC family oxidoreductase [Streptomyces sp. NPDC051658]|uniref:SgcJ/EcaC family oxidoreductase n=1 Tax=Streptomyces sp. NPDC051658 TaxID=3365667 RepID=UPI0037A2D2C1